MHFSEYDTRLAAYAVVVNAGDHMLLTWYNGLGTGSACWSLPGGGVEYEESLEEAAAREVHEETGYEVEVGRPLASHSFTVLDHERGRPFKSVRLLFDATVTGGMLGTLEVDGSTDFAEWVPINDVANREPRADIVALALAIVTEQGRAVR